MQNFAQGKRFLIVRPDRIGDVVLSTPIPREIKGIYPGSFVAVMVRNYTKDIYIHNPCINSILTLEHPENNIPKKMTELLKEIKSYNFDYAFMLLPNEKINWLLFLAGIKYRIGVGQKFYQFLTNVKNVYRRKYQPLRHEADYCLDMLRKIGIQPQSIYPEIYLTEEEKNLKNDLRNKYLQGKKFMIGVHVKSGNSAPNLSVLKYKQLIDKIMHLPEVSLLVTDNNPPEEIIEIKNVSFPNVNNNLRSAIVNISALDVLISASTGPMHIAATLKIPTISLFCPLTACSPKLWGPLGNNARIIEPDENYCSFICSGNPKTCDFEGSGGVDVDKIMRELQQFLLQKDI
jgi:heptosyltransferase-2